MRLPCPKGWEYEHLPNARVILTRRAEQILLEIRQSTPRQNLTAARNTRPIHAILYHQLTPPGFPYFAGNYRGSKHWCLDQYEVHIPNDRRVGYSSANVAQFMEEFSGRIATAIALVDQQLQMNTPLTSEPLKLVAYVAVLAALFVEFLEAHPYANGNGHMGRFLLLALLARRQIYPTAAWRIDPRPKDPPYSNLIARYRDGDQLPLIQFILDAL